MRGRWALAAVLLVMVGVSLLSVQSVGAATVTVTNTNDSGAGSLRQAIADAAAAGTVGFAPVVAGTITLTSGTLILTKDVTIQGPGASTLAISGGRAVQVFAINSGVTAAINGVGVTGGWGIVTGGGIHNSGVLSMTDCIVSGNVATASGTENGTGGGIDNDGTLTLSRTTVS